MLNSLHSVAIKESYMQSVGRDSADPTRMTISFEAASSSEHPLMLCAYTAELYTDNPRTQDLHEP
jgi:hypothetical protein